jgi:hypothetical protein
MNWYLTSLWLWCWHAGPGDRGCLLLEVGGVCCEVLPLFQQAGDVLHDVRAAGFPHDGADGAPEQG